MAKKKKKGKTTTRGGGVDARGYGQSTPTTNTKTTATTAAAPQEELQSLVSLLTVNNDETTTTTTTITTASHRFRTQLERILDALQEYGFTITSTHDDDNDDPTTTHTTTTTVVSPQQQQQQYRYVEEMVQALGYTLTLERALDWFCLHVPTLELPPRFTDGRWRTAAAAKNNSSHHHTSSSSSSTLEVLQWSTSRPSIAIVSQQKQQDTHHSSSVQQPKEPTIPRIVPQQQQQQQLPGGPVTMQPPQEEEDYEHAQQQQIQKDYLLQHYQYVDDDEEYYDDHVQDDNEDDDDDDDDDKKEEVDAFLSPEEIEYQRLQVQVQELQADLSNEANNYFRSKAEIKQLRNTLKQQTQMLQGLQRKIDKIQKAKMIKRRQEEEAAATAAAGPDDDEEEEMGGGGFAMDLFGGGGEEEEDDEDDEDPEATQLEKTKTTPESNSISQKVAVTVELIDARIPRNWRGNTPQRALEDWCRKQKRPRPKFTKLPYQQGFSLALPPSLSKKKKSNQEPMTFVGYHRDFCVESSVPDYLALQALYAMEPTMSLHLMFPPAFRTLWLSWMQEVALAKQAVSEADNQVKRQRIDYLLSLITTSTTTATDVTAKTELDDGAILAVETTASSEDIREAWDEDGTDEDKGPKASLPCRPSRMGERLREKFSKLQQTKDYQEMLRLRESLPMASFKSEILETVAQNRVTIISAQTGAGKTTQCPQFLLEQALETGQVDQMQILVTQPRRVAATSVAERVSEEMCEPKLGGLVGYQIRMEAVKSAETRLLFCTTGIVLRRLQDDRNLQGITHVVVDEVHERQQQTDVLLIALRELLETTRPDLKVILMSATLDSKLFCGFFGGAPLIEVPGRTFPVSSYHLEDCLDATNHIVEEGSRYARRDYSTPNDKATLWVTNKGGDKRREVVDLQSQTDVTEVSDAYAGYKMSTRRSMDRVNEEVINFDLLEDVLTLILCQPDANTTLLPPDGADLSTGSVLVFLPGLGEIRAMTERLQGNRQFRDGNRFEVIPMHSTLSSKDQRRAFLPPRKGCRKIILSTNICETSVTVPDVVCVIDTGRLREVRRNKRTSTSILVTDWCSKASAKQRAGRAGRVQPGLCLKLFSSHTAQSVMKAASEPELRRVPLEEVCLSILAGGFGRSSMHFLSKAPQPPEEASVKAAVEILEDVGAIEVNEEAPSSPKRIETLTPLGRHLAKLPVDVRLGKMLIFGTLFRCLDKVLTIAASLSSKSPFATYFNDANVAKAKHQAFASGDSDYETYCNVWEAYHDALEHGQNAARKFCQANYLSTQAMREIHDARRQFLDLLCGIGFVNRNSIQEGGIIKSIYNENADKPELLNAVFCAGSYPNIANLTPTTSGYELYHKTERLYFHNTSVNARKKHTTEAYLCFHEKFGTAHRVSVSTTCMVHPFALILFGGSIQVKHVERLVVVDGWMQLGMAAQVGVLLKELRKQVNTVLAQMIEGSSSTKDSQTAQDMAEVMVQGIVNLLSSST